MFLGIDIGTGSVKVLLLDSEGQQHLRTKTYRVSAPKLGWAEIDPEIWLNAVRSAISDLPTNDAITAIGFSGQMHGIVPVRVQGKRIESIGNAITWADRRGASYVRELESLSPAILESMGNRPSAGMAAISLLWLRDHEPRAFGRADMFLLAKDYIRAQFTGQCQTDYSDASGTLLYNFTSHTWNDALLNELGLSEKTLPEIVYGNSVTGTVTESAAAFFGVPQGIPVIAGAGDTPASVAGTWMEPDGSAQISIGTAAQITMIAPPDFRIQDRSLSLFEGAFEGQRLVVAAMLNGGLALEWVRQILKFSWDELYNRLEERGLREPMDLLFIPHLSGERTPYMDSTARGSWVGLSLHHQSEDLALAALLGVALSVRLGVDTLTKTEMGNPRVLRLVGGSAHYPFWRQLLTGVLGRAIHVSTVANSSALGAVRLAAEGVHAGTLLPRPEFTVEPVQNIPWIDAYYRRYLETTDWLRNHSGTSSLDP